MVSPSGQKVGTGSRTIYGLRTRRGPSGICSLGGPPRQLLFAQNCPRIFPEQGREWFDTSGTKSTRFRAFLE